MIKRSIKNSSTSEKLEIIKSDKSIVEEKAYRLALDCDMIFCCVDRPWGRSVLNHIAYAHLIPVIDGGIAIEFNQDRSLDFADWTVHTISPGRPCMQCLEAFYPSDVDLEMKGQLENPSYIQGLPNNHHLKNRQNISPFTYNLASMEVMHFMVLATDLVDADFYCEQRFRFKHGHLSKNQSQCDPYCDYINNIGVGDSILKVFNTSQ